MKPGYRFADGTEVRTGEDKRWRLLREPGMTATPLCDCARCAGRVYTHESTVAALGYDRAHALGFGDLYKRLWRIT